MQKLMLADDLFADVLSGKQSNTVRYGKRDITQGNMILEATEGTQKPIKVTVTQVEHVKFANLTLQHLRTQGIKSDNRQQGLNIFLREMKRFYPDVSFESTVTVIVFTNPRPHMAS